MKERLNLDSWLAKSDLLSLWESRGLAHPRERDPILPSLASSIRNDQSHFEDLTQTYPVESLTQNEFIETLEQLSDAARGGLVKAGPHRRENWVSGWSENLEEAREENFSPRSVRPKYFRQNQLQRFNNWLYKTEGLGFEPDFLNFLVDNVVKYDAERLQLSLSKNRPIVAEFGCGTGHHLMRLAQELNKGDIELVGLDWAESSQQLLEEFSKRTDLEVKGYHFDYFNPAAPPSWISDPGTKERLKIFFTVASLEQVGDQYESFIDFVLQQQPDVVVHFEPISELLHGDALGDLSREYFSARNYLSGFLDKLEYLEANGALKILSAERVGFGSQFTEGYSLIRWCPNLRNDYLT